MHNDDDDDPDGRLNSSKMNRIQNVWAFSGTTRKLIDDEKVKMNGVQEYRIEWWTYI